MGCAMTTVLLVALRCDAPYCTRETIASDPEDTAEDVAFQAHWGSHEGGLFCDHHIDDARAGQPFGAVPPEWF
jgi:hypothetical protein